MSIAGGATARRGLYFYCAGPSSCRGFYRRADSPPVFERCVRKEGCHPTNGRTPALGLKSLHNMTNFFAQLLFPASRSFASVPQISCADRGTLFGTRFRKSRIRTADPLTHAAERWSRLFQKHGLQRFSQPGDLLIMKIASACQYFVAKVRKVVTENKRVRV